ncbi:nitroreductase family protein, partial [Thermoproteota archaeon]
KWLDGDNMEKRIILVLLIFAAFFINLKTNEVLASAEEKIDAFHLIKEYGYLTEMPLEEVISRRMSIHYGDEFSNETVPWELVTKVLWAAYGVSWRSRTIPSLTGYPILIYICNETAAYRFVPDNQSVTLWKEGDYRELSGGISAPFQLYIAYNSDICEDVNWANAESGCPIQNIYLIANALNLGTVCLGGPGIDRDLIHDELGLAENEIVLYKMPLGYPLPPNTNYQQLIPTTRPSSSELPEIKDSTISLDYALEVVYSSQEWSENPITKQQLSQILWASYGYSYYEDTAGGHPKRHRTVPSAGARYPMKIYAVNSSGVYEYIPELHTLITITDEDRRIGLAIATENLWASSAPLIIVLAWDDTNILSIPTTYIEVGLISQNIYLESSAVGLITDWGRADRNEEAVKTSLGLTKETNLHPVSIITLGHPSTYYHKIEWNAKIYPVEIETNSTIMNFDFNQMNRLFRFDILGPPGTFGQSNITISNNLLWGDFMLLINGNAQTNLMYNANSTHTSFYFNYVLSDQIIVQLQSEYVIPEFQVWSPLLILSISIFILFRLKKYRINRLTNNGEISR